MRILIISTLKRKITAEETHARSQIIYKLAHGLTQKGYEVSLLGTKDSVIPGVKTIPVIEKGWVDLSPAENPFFLEVATMVQLTRKIVEIQSQFDIIHNHLYPEFLPPIIENELKIPLVTTIHIQAENYIDETLALFKKTKLISISNAHRSLFKKAPIYKVVHNGIDTNLFSYNERKEDYLLWIGRLSQTKKTPRTINKPKKILVLLGLHQILQQLRIFAVQVFLLVLFLILHMGVLFYVAMVKPHLC